MIALQPGFDPHRHWLQLRLRNRLADWRQRPGESLFHALGAAVLLVLLAWLLSAALQRLAEPAQALLQSWPWLTALVVLLILVQRQRARLGELSRARRGDWLAAQPIPPRVRRRADHRRQAAEAALQLGLGLMLAALLDLSAPALWGYAGLVALAAVLGRASASDVAAAPGSRLSRQPSGSGGGRLWRWQWIEAGAARFGPGLAPGAFALLLVPVGGSGLLALVLLLIGLTISALATAWRRSLGVIPTAQAWLGAQPLRGGHWLRETAPLPLGLLALSGALLLAATAALGLGLLAWAAAAGLIALGLLQLLCLLAEPTRPRRAALRFILLATALLACLQLLPPLAPLLWLGVLAWLLRRVLRA